ncbi:MFS transporter [Yinghuangia soli]|uniref:MFS transporter n=1 Tax=Yinghuangia soli TaxID=2908204 RepID=A0AA41Q1P1_9ACTN|nr:MFS transporter [Yinghuangia soli]MCF2529676.1 MFS transporter [Yinghuangia soli]
MTSEATPQGTALPQEAGHPRRWLILIVMMLCMFITVMDNNIMTAALASVQESLGATNAELQWSMDSYTLTFAALMLAAGVLGDRYGRRLVLVGGLLFFAAASAFGAWSGDPAQLIGWRAAMGIGAAVVPGCSMGVISNVFPEGERAKAFALWSISAGLGIAAGPVIGGALLGGFWWGSVLLVNVPFALVAVVLTLMFVPENRDPAPGRLDLAGVGLSIAGVGTLVFGIISGGEPAGWGRAIVLGSIGAGILILGLLLVVERRVGNPAVDLSLFRKRSFAAGSAVLCTSAFAIMGAGFVLVFYLQVARGFSPLKAGLLMLPVALGAMVSGALGASLADRFGYVAVVAPGALLMAASLAFYGTIEQDTSLVVIEIAQTAAGLGFGATLAPVMAVALSEVPPARAGAGSAIANTMRHTGTALGIAVLGSVLGSVYRGQLGSAGDGLPDEAVSSLGATLRAKPEIAEPAHAAFMDALHASMLVGAGIALLCAVVALTCLPGRPRADVAVAGSAPQAAPDGHADLKGSRA